MERLDENFHDEYPDRWTFRDQNQADQEGWAIYEAHGGLEIEANDVNDWEGAQDFRSDDEAVEHVRRRAAQGSELHQRALAIHEKYLPRIRGKTFEEFHATGREVADLKAIELYERSFSDDREGPIPGRAYMDDELFIEGPKDGPWCVTVGNDSRMFSSLEMAEWFLFEAVMDEYGY